MLLIQMIAALAALTLGVGIVIHTLKARRAYNGQLVVVRTGLDKNNVQARQDLTVLAKDVKATYSHDWEHYLA